MSANDKQVGGAHYQGVEIQHWDFTWEHRYNQFEYCMSKYVLRAHKKNGLQDIQKAIHHCQKYLEVIGNTTRNIPCRTLSEVLEFSSQFDDLEVLQILALNMIHMDQPELVLIKLREYESDLECRPGRTYVNPDL